MGYCMSQDSCKFLILKKNKAKALKAIKELSKRTNEGKGFSSCGNGIERFFSWVDTSEFVNAKTLEDALFAWRWETETNDKGNIISLDFNGEKLGDDMILFEMILFEVIAPYVEKESMIGMTGEDGYRWAWCFNGEKCIEKAGKVIYDN